MRRWNRQLAIGLCVVLAWNGAAFGVIGDAGDPKSVSTSYQMIESEIGGNGCDPHLATPFCSTSASYSTDPFVDAGGSSLGETAVGTSSSASYSSGAGFNTTEYPGLMVNVTSGPAGLGTLSTGGASTATATFSVRDYTSSGYVVQIFGTTPSYAGHPLTAMTSPTTCPDAWGCASVAGSEQFGLNLVANTSPTTVGANPICQTTETPGPTAYCSGVAGNGVGTYGLNASGGTPYTVNSRYRYVSGETVAMGASSSGETDYTITFLANQSTTTPAGVYSGNLDISVTGTF